MATPRLLYVVTEDWYFLSHRLPMARAAKAAGYDVHVATRIKEGRMVIEKEGFTTHALSWSRGSLSAFGSLAGVRRATREDLVAAVGAKVADAVLAFFASRP